MKILLGALILLAATCLQADNASSVTTTAGAGAAYGFSEVKLEIVDANASKKQNKQRNRVARKKVKKGNQE